MPKKQYNEDGVGGWTEIKLKNLKKYLGAYTNILHYGGFNEYYFLDLFAGEGICRSRKTKQIIEGSPLIALNVEPFFSKYYFCEINVKIIQELEKIKQESPIKKRIEIYQGDCNIQVDTILKKIKNDTPFIALLDPQAGDLFWDTIIKISKFNKSEILINFPLGMAITRYMPLVEGKKITKEMERKLYKIFGHNKWQAIYKARKEKKLTAPQTREKYLDLYLKGLISLGYKYYTVKNLKNSKNSHLYYLIFITKHRRGLEKMKDIFVKDEQVRNSLFFKQDVINKILKKFKGHKNINLDNILEFLLPGKHNYRVQDFKDALKSLEKEKILKRVTPRKRARSFNNNELFHIF